MRKALRILSAICALAASGAHAQSSYAAMYGVPDPLRLGSFISTAPSGSTSFLANAGGKYCFTNTCSIYLTNFTSDHVYLVGAGRLTVGAVRTPVVFTDANSPIGIASSTNDSASAVGITLNNTTALTTSGAKIISILNNYVEKASFDKDGTLTTLGSVILGGNVTAPSGNIIAGVDIRSNSGIFTSNIGGVTEVLRGTAADGSTAVATAVDNSVSLANSTAKLLSIRNNGTEKLYVDKDGWIRGMGANVGIDWLGVAQIFYTNNQIWLSVGSGAVANSWMNGNANAPNTLTSNRSNALNAIGTQINTTNTFNSAGEKLVQVTNNSTEKWALDFTGKEQTTFTDSSGTPGSATANTNCGRAALAAAASTLTITDSNVTAASNVLLQLETSGAGVSNLVVVPAAGSFAVTSINGTGVATVTTGITKFSWCVKN